MRTVGKGDLVAVHYTGTLASGEEFDKSSPERPLRFEVGGGQVIPGFDDAVIGLKVGEKRTVTIPPDRAYGKTDPERVIKVDREAFGEEGPPPVGTMVGLRHESGHHMPARVAAIGKKEVKLDLNHPLAGEALTFAVEMVEIRDAGQEGNEAWLEEGHEHGCDDESCSSCSGCGHDHGDGDEDDDADCACGCGCDDDDDADGDDDDDDGDDEDDDEDRKPADKG